MRSVLATVLTLSAVLSGCAVMPEAPADAPPPVVVAEPVAAGSASSGEDLPMLRSARSLPSPVSRPAVHTAAAGTASAIKPAVLTTRRAEPVPVKFVEQALNAGLGVTPPSRSAPASKDSVVKAQPGPAWLKACQHRQQQADVIMCDADSLLAPPSDKVMVYVRDAKLSGKQPDGQRIALRESLPRLYRIFVLD